jgi:hypothetical protein
MEKYLPSRDIAVEKYLRSRDNREEQYLRSREWSSVGKDVLAYICRVLSPANYSISAGLVFSPRRQVPTPT